MQSEALFLLPELECHDPVGAAHFSARLGRIGELRAEAHLLQRDYEVSHPSIDNGIDLIVNDTIGVQVKTATLSARHQTDRCAYGFHINRPGRTYVRAPDIFVLYGYTHDCWWIVPRTAVAGFGQNLNLSPPELGSNPNGRGRPSRSHHLHAYLDAWGVFDGD